MSFCLAIVGFKTSNLQFRICFFFSAELFIQVSEAFKVLTDPVAKAAFDKVLEAKEKARLRTKAFDAKRKNFKEGIKFMIKSVQKRLSVGTFYHFPFDRIVL